ncbi:hypothetical protein D5086_033138 [Populus alba]|uniref:Uncharacterized protein n=1 Tax=Populus alba TaxID=43335 RepID=A0ACC4AG04_POPAL
MQQGREGKGSGKVGRGQMVKSRALPSEPLAHQHPPCPLTSTTFLGFFILSSQPAQLENKKLRAETERVKAEDFDAEEGEPLEEEDELFDQGKDKTSEERRIAICIFDEHYNMVPMSLSCKKPAINDENPDVRQAAVYGIGICAGLGGSGSVTCWRSDRELSGPNNPYPFCALLASTSCIWKLNDLLLFNSCFSFPSHCNIVAGAVAMSWFSLGSGSVLSKFLLHRRAMSLFHGDAVACVQQASVVC